MLTVEPRTAIWDGSGAKVETRADVSEPARAMPTNLKFQRTDFVWRIPDVRAMFWGYSSGYGSCNHKKARSIDIIVAPDPSYERVKLWRPRRLTVRLRWCGRSEVLAHPALDRKD